MKYKILVIEHCLAGNQTAKFGEIVDESQLTAPAKELIDAGFIEESEDESSEDKPSTKKVKK